MTTNTPSLRLRLLALILVPLVAISGIVGIWQFSNANRTASELFDRTLLASSYAIARDVAVTEGDTLSLSTWDILNDAAGGKIYYHVNGPDGAFVIGYATPPVPPPGSSRVAEAPFFYNSVHLGAPVRVVRLREHTEANGISGYTVVTTWQRFGARQDFAQSLAERTMVVILILIVTVAGVVWFGVNLGLRPLTDLQEAISKRSPDDLGKIRRSVPPEISGIVQTLNTLFEQVSEAISSKDEFVSNAAHQLRNPVAGVLALAEAAGNAKTDKDRRERVQDLVTAARHTSRVATQLLSFERARVLELPADMPAQNLTSLIEDVVARAEGGLGRKGIALSHTGTDPVYLRCDPTLITEAVQNLIDNAATHGRHTTRIDVEVLAQDQSVEISVTDDGKGLAPKDYDLATGRFSQVGTSEGSGLGLAIVKMVCERHGGQLQIAPRTKGARLVMIFPRPVM